jgi:hypothetical protein
MNIWTNEGTNNKHTHQDQKKRLLKYLQGQQELEPKVEVDWAAKSDAQLAALLSSPSQTATHTMLKNMGVEYFLASSWSTTVCSELTLKAISSGQPIKRKRNAHARY